MEFISYFLRAVVKFNWRKNKALFLLRIYFILSSSGESTNIKIHIYYLNLGRSPGMVLNRK
jgi:hypothetical protein